MKYQALFSSKDKTKKLKCRLLQFSFGSLMIKTGVVVEWLEQLGYGAESCRKA